MTKTKRTRAQRRTEQQKRRLSENGNLLPRPPKSLHRNVPKRNRDVRPTLHIFIRICELTYFTGGPRVEVEYEQEMESVPLTKEMLANW